MAVFFDVIKFDTCESQLKSSQLVSYAYIVSRLIFDLDIYCLLCRVINTENTSMERLEVLEAASTLMSLRRHCDERTQWQQIRNNVYLPHPSTVISPFYNQWPIYKTYPYDINSGMQMQLQQFSIPPYMVAPRPWYPAHQPWLGQIRSTENTWTSLQASEMTLPPLDNSKTQVAMETTDDDGDDNDECAGKI